MPMKEQTYVLKTASCTPEQREKLRKWAGRYTWPRSPEVTPEGDVVMTYEGYKKHHEIVAVRVNTINFMIPLMQTLHVEAK